MKTLAAAGLVALLAGCGGSPEPLDLGVLEQSDQAFADPRRPDPREIAESILKQEELTLDDVLRIADHLNPDLAAERKNIDLATAAVWEASLGPNPFFLAEVEEFHSKDGLGASERTAGVGLPLVVSGRVGAATAVAEKEREIAALSYVWRRREILSEVKKAFLAHLAARRSVALARETRDIARTFHQATEARFKNEAAPEMELLKSAVELAKAENDLKLAERDLQASIKTLNARAGNIDLPKGRFAGDLAVRLAPPDLEVLKSRALTGHPLLEMASKEREAATLRLDLAQARRIPDVDLEFQAGKDPEDETIFKGGVSIPIPIVNANQAQISRAEHDIRRAELRAQAVRNQVLLDLNEVHRAFLAAQDRATVFRDEILPKAQKALDQTLLGQKAGKFGYLDVLDSQRTLAEARIALAAALSDLNQSAVDLEKLTGTKIETQR